MRSWKYSWVLALCLGGLFVLSSLTGAQAQVLNTPACQGLLKKVEAIKQKKDSFGKRLLAAERAYAAAIKQLRLKELVFQRKAFAQADALERVGQKFAQTIQHEWDGGTRNFVLGLAKPVPPLPGGAILHDTFSRDLLSVPFAFSIDGPAGGDLVFGTLLTEYFALRYAEPDYGSGASLSKYNAQRAELIKRTVSSIIKMRTDLKKVFLARLQSSDCRSLEEGGVDCDSQTHAKLQQIRAALKRARSQMTVLESAYNGMVQSEPYRRCQDPRWRFTRANCKDYAINVDMVGRGLPPLVIPAIPSTTYAISVAGTWDCGDGIFLADAKYTSFDGGAWLEGFNNFPEEVCELLVDGSRQNWGGFSNAHQYEVLYTAPTASLTFKLWDPADGGQNDAGGLSLRICEARY